WWTDSQSPGSVHRLTKGVVDSDMLATSTATYPKNIVADQNAAYWVELGAAGFNCVSMPHTSFVWRSPVDLGSLSSKVAVATCPLLAQDQKAIYFTDQDSPPGMYSIYLVAK